MGKARDLDTLFPLSERGLPWDPEAAVGRWAEMPPEFSYADGFFWYEEGNYALPFVDIVDGKPVAVWRAVTAAAGALMGARGGVDIPGEDRAAVKERVLAYYELAREAFSDAAIMAPWERDGKASMEGVAFQLAYAEAGKTEEGVEREAIWLEALEPLKKWTFSGSTVTSTASNTGNVTFTTVQLLDEHQPAEQLPRKNRSPKAPDVEVRTNAGEVRWEASLCPEGSLTDDGRMFAPGSIAWRELPLSLMVMTETGEGHDGAWLGGRIDKIWRDGSDIRGSGVFTDNDEGRKAAKLVADGALKGVSVDIAVKEYEVAQAADLFDAEGALVWPPPEKEEAEGEPNLLDILFDDGGEKPVFVVTEGVIGAVTVCPFPAFADANISLTASGLLWTVKGQGGYRLVRIPAKAEKGGEPAGEVLTAAAAGLAPTVPPAEWFENPGLDDLTPLRVTDEGRVFGHAAGWDTCHIGIADVCTMAPRSTTDYSLFHLGAVRVDTDDEVGIGKITLGTGHAPKHLDWQGAAAHYDNTGTVVADVVCGEDEHGVWVSGALRPDVDEARVRELRAAVLSGDWRSFNGNLELVALLAVNVPGFPIPRKRALVAAGEDGAQVLTLTAAGIATGLPATREDLDAKDLARLALLVERARGSDILLRLTELAESLGGKPNEGTNPDKRLKENKKRKKQAAAAEGECTCGHMADEHAAGGEGTCTVAGCDCQSFEAKGGYQAELRRLAEAAKS